MDKQKSIFGSPHYVITDRGTAFSSDEFRRYCDDECIRHSMITTGLPRANGQIERINRSIIPILTKLTGDDPSKWYKHVEKLQYFLNSTYQRSVGTTPFQLLIGILMKCKEDLHLKELLDEELRRQFFEDRQEQREKAKTEIFKTQQEN